MTILIWEEERVRKANIKDLLEMAKALLLLIPIGRVTSYKEVALMLDISPRLVGRLMAMNNEAPIIPCHRVVRSDGHFGGYSARKGVEIKRKILMIEGVKFRNKEYVSKEVMLSLREFYE